MTRLTRRRLNAIQFALNFVEAGWLDETLKSSNGVTAEDLDAAGDWVAEELIRRGHAAVIRSEDQS